MSFQENKKTEKYKLPLQQQFKFHAFHPKAVNNQFVCGRSSGLLSVEYLPIPLWNSGLKIQQAYREW